MDDRAAYLRKLLDCLDLKSTQTASVLSLLAALGTNLTSPSFKPDESLWQRLHAPAQWTWESIVEEEPLVGEHWETLEDADAVTLVDSEEQQSLLEEEPNEVKDTPCPQPSGATSLYDRDGMMRRAEQEAQLKELKLSQYWQSTYTSSVPTTKGRFLFPTLSQRHHRIKLEIQSRSIPMSPRH